MDVFDYLNTYTSIGSILLILGSLYYSISGLLKILKAKKFLLFSTIATTIIVLPFLLIKIWDLIFLLENKMMRIWILIPYLSLVVLWLLIGGLINGLAEKINNNSYIPFYKSGNPMNRVFGVLFTLLAILIWNIEFSFELNIPILHFILLLAWGPTLYFSAHLLILGKFPSK